MNEMQTEESVGSLMVHQHRHLIAIMGGVANSTGDLRAEAFDQFRQFLAAHEAAERQYLHTTALNRPGEHHGTVESCMGEEDDITELVGRLERCDPDSVEFMSLFKEVTERVLAHMRAEEYQEMPMLSRVMEPTQLTAAAEAISRVPQMAERAIGNVPYKDWQNQARAAFSQRGDE